jgi:hypothetical protein
MALGTALTGAAWAQSSITTYVTDIEGNRVAASTTSSSDHTRTQQGQSINGGTVPLEKTEERVLHEDASGKVTERIVKKFNATGELASTERTVTDERKTAAGSTVQQTTWRSDVNGNLNEAERRSTDTRINGTNSNTDVVVARPNINGNLETTEKRSIVTTGPEDNKQTNESVYRPNPNGEMAEALRQVTVSTKNGDKTTDHTSYYEPGLTGTLDLTRQSVSTTTKLPDGSESKEVDLYGRSAYGVAREPGAPQQVIERQLITRQKNADGSVVETLSVRRPTVSDPTQLGSVQKISETVCTGKCE